MFPILYTSITEGTVPSHYGEGVLSDCISCTSKEARNGEYELTMEYAAYGIHCESIQPGAYIKAKPNFTDDPQLFRVYKVGKVLNGRFTVNAEHNSYLLSDKVITSGSAGSAAAACLLLTGAAGNFSITTDKVLSGTFNIDVPSSVRSWFGGKTGSILDVYGPGEWKYDNFSAEFMANRGTDRGVTIRYGKNLTELSQTLDMSNLVSSVIPYYKDSEGNVTTGTEVPTGLVGITRQLAVDFSSSVDPESGVPISTQLATLATNYIANNNLTVLKNSITLDFVQLKDLAERVDLCDTVHIYFEPLGITATAKCIETVWDVLEERYISTSFGDPRTNIADTIVQQKKEIEEKPSTSQMQAAVEHATEKITGNLGGYVILHDSNGDGEPDEILIMDTPDISTAVKVWRFNQGGLGYSGSGYAGPFDKLALTNDGQIVATAITTGVLNANLIKAGVISDVAGNSTIDMTNGKAEMKDFDAVNSFNLTDGNGNTRASIKYTSFDGGGFELYNDNGDRIASILENALDGANMGLMDASSVQTIRMGASGTGGGWYEAKNANGQRTFLMDGTANGNGFVEIWDAGGQNEAALKLLDKDGNQEVIAQVTSGGGRVDVNSEGFLFGSLRVYNNGGVLDLYDSNFLTIQGTGSNGNITCVSLTQTSSRKVKENIQPMTDFKKILELDAVSFDFKNKNRGTDKRGFIAEDVAKVLPNLVTPETEKMPASLDYVGMIPYLQAVIKDQEKRIQALENKLKDK